MPAKRKSRSAGRSAGAGSPARVTPPDGEAIELAAPIVLPSDGTGVVDEPPAPKAGPAIRGGAQSAGVNRGRGAQSSRRYAFRRS